MKQPVHEACLLLGSNIRPEDNLPLAVDLLQKRTKLLQASSVWETAAVGSDGPNFLNAAVLVSSPFDAQALKEQVLHPIEAQLGRVRTHDKNAPRTIDIDIIFFNGRLMDAALWTQAHRAVPVAEILPESPSETGEKLKNVALRLSDPSRIKLRTDIAVGEIIK